ncbi:hypothetical protein ACTQ46_03075 [Gallicola sp. Sow4_E12]|uniref:hypothetical protein n=1 Tax=Gallicola sp. Sow4_E12 TaxID=3438785 RepID=UPI003F91E59D
MISELILRNYNASLASSPLQKIAVVCDEGRELFELESNRRIRYVEDDRLFKLCAQEFSDLLSFPYYKFKYEEFKIVPNKGTHNHKSNPTIEKLKILVLYFEDGEPFNKGKILGLAYQHEETGEYRIIYIPNDKSEWVYSDGYKNKYSFSHTSKNILSKEVGLKS